MAVNKSDFIRWRSDEVTQEYIKDVLADVDSYLAYLAQRAGMEPTHDRWIVGKIEGLRWVVDWQPEFMIDDKEEDEDADD